MGVILRRRAVAASAVAALVSLAGSWAPADAVPLRHELGVVNDPGFVLSGTWTSSSNAAFSGGSLRASTAAGALITFTYTVAVGMEATFTFVAGTGASCCRSAYRYRVDGGSWIADTLVDGTPQDQDIEWTIGPYPAGVHVLEIERTNGDTKNFEADAIEVNETVDPLATTTTTAAPTTTTSTTAAPTTTTSTTAAPTTTTSSTVPPSTTTTVAPDPDPGAVDRLEDDDLWALLLVVGLAAGTVVGGSFVGRRS